MFTSGLRIFGNGTDVDAGIQRLRRAFDCRLCIAVLYDDEEHHSVDRISRGNFPESSEEPPADSLG